MWVGFATEDTIGGRVRVSGVPGYRPAGVSGSASSTSSGDRSKDRVTVVPPLAS